MSIEEQNHMWESKGRDWVQNLMPTLRGHDCVWHRCTVEGLRGIVQYGAILPFGENTEKSCVMDCQAHRLDAVPLFDFDRPAENDVYRMASLAWAQFLHHQHGITVWLRIPVDRLESCNLLFQGSREARENPLIRPEFKKIPHVEAWHFGQIDWRHVDQTVAARVPFGGDEPYTLTELNLATAVVQAQCLREKWGQEWQARRQTELAKPGVSQISILDARKGIYPNDPPDPQSEGARALAEAQARLERTRPKDGTS